MRSTSSIWLSKQYIKYTARSCYTSVRICLITSQKLPWFQFVSEPPSPPQIARIDSHSVTCISNNGTRKIFHVILLHQSFPIPFDLNKPTAFYIHIYCAMRWSPFGPNKYYCNWSPLETAWPPSTSRSFPFNSKLLHVNIFKWFLWITFPTGLAIFGEISEKLSLFNSLVGLLVQFS